MRWTIIIVASGALLAAGIAISQQPPGGAPQANPAALAPGVISGTRAPPQAAGQGYAVIAVPQGQTAANYPYPQLPNPYFSSFVAFDDPEIAELNQLDQKLEQESRALVNQLAQTEEDANVNGAKEKLREVLEKQFDAQQKIREIEIARIEERVKKLRDVVNKRNGARRTIVDRRQQQLIDEVEGFGWSSPGTSSPNGGFDPYAAPPAGYGASNRIWSNQPQQPPNRSSFSRPGAALPGATPPATKEPPAATPRGKRPE